MCVWVREVDVSSRVICVLIWEMQQYVSVWVPDERFAKKKKRERRKEKCKEKKDRATLMIVKEENGGVIKKERESVECPGWVPALS